MLQAFFAANGCHQTYWVAYSGGIDSHVLLALCAEFRRHTSIKLRAIHINHNLSPHAQAWSNHCKAICAEYDIDLIVREIKLDLQAGESLEEEARKKRYAVFAEYVNIDDVLLTAHHQDDQAETMLMQLMRGAGLKGLSAMPAMKVFAKGWHARPLLDVDRVNLQQYAQANQLRWIDDESNQNSKMTRNFIRHHVLSVLKERWSSATNVIARSAAHCAEAQALLEQFALELCEQVKGSVENTLSIQKLLTLEEAKQRLVLRTWIHGCGFSLPNVDKIEVIRSNVLTAANDRMPCVTWGEVEVRRFRDDLFLLSALKQHKVQQCHDWNLQQPLVLPHVGVLQAEKVNAQNSLRMVGDVQVRFRQGGEVINLPNRGRHKLKNLFQEWNVTPWLRDRIPLIFIGETCIAAVGYFIDPDYVADANESGWLVSFAEIFD